MEKEIKSTFGGDFVDVKTLERKIKHARKRVNEFKESHGDNPSQTHTYHGGWSLGYWQGKLSAYEDLLDEIEESKA